MNAYKRIALDVSALPLGEPFFDKLAPIFQTRVEERCAAKVAADGEFVVSLSLNKALAAEAFELRDTEKGVEIAGADFNALVFGMGQFLHKSRYGADGIVPSAWRGTSVPKTSLRCIYFAMHFFNWYQQCTQDELERYMEDLMLWGLNTVAVIYPRMNLTGWDDPDAERLFGLLRKVFSAAKKMNMKTVYQSSNQDFMKPDPRYAADKTLIIGPGNLICPGTEAGYQHLKSMIMPAVVEAAKIGLDYVSFFSYDEGGCHCEKCWPWPAKGQYNYAKRMSREIKEELNLPDLKTIIATWYYGRGEGHEVDWPSFYDRVREDEAKGEDWIDLIFVETRDHPSCKYILEHPWVSEKIKVATFPDVCMMGFEPWGCCGAQVAVTQVFSEHDAYKHVSNGGCYMYSEGIFDDINKVVCAELAWDETLSLHDAVADYVGYEFPGVDVEKCFEMILCIDRNHNLTNKFALHHPEMDKAERADALADELDAQIYAPYKGSWRWRILYIRAKLDLVRYRNCEAAGWPVEDYPKSFRNHGNYFWGRYLNDTEQSREYLRELIRIYHASMVDDPEKFVCHNRLRPPLTD